MLIGHHFLTCPLQNDPPVFQDIGPVAHGQGLSHILFNKKNRDSFLVDPLDHFQHLMNQDRGKAQRRLVKHHQPGKRHEAPAYGKHLLFTAGKGACHLLSSLSQPWEEFVDSINAFRTSAPGLSGQGTHDQVLFHAHLGKKPSAFRHVDDSILDDFMGR